MHTITQYRLIIRFNFRMFFGRSFTTPKAWLRSGYSLILLVHAVGMACGVTAAIPNAADVNQVFYNAKKPLFFTYKGVPYIFFMGATFLLNSPYHQCFLNFFFTSPNFLTAWVFMWVIISSIESVT